MRLLHTSDWHLGRRLYGKNRDAEFEAFLAWLTQTIVAEQVDALLVAGDIFDTSTPGHRAQELYYRFLCQVAASSCRHVVIIAGNHDSPSFLDAPKALLGALDVHVVGSTITDRPDDEVLVLSGTDGKAELIVCAVPYLRDRDIRRVEPGEGVEEKGQKLRDGIREHYRQVCAVAERTRAQSDTPVPVVAMGHLFAAGGKTLDDDGVRDLYVGSIAHVTAAVFPETIDYLALGHLHIPQKVGGSEVMRYSGSPLPMGFGEARQQKSVCLVDFRQWNGGKVPPSVELVDIPVFQKIECVRGSWDTIEQRVAVLVSKRESVWLEVIYEGREVVPDLSRRLDAAVADSKVEILRVKNTRIMEQVLTRMDVDETLEDLSIDEVFERCLSAHEIPDMQRPELLAAYREIVMSLHDDGAGA